MAYAVYCIHEDRATSVQSLRGKIGKAVANYGNTVQVLDGFPAGTERDRANPAVTVYLGSPAGQPRQNVDGRSVRHSPIAS